MRMNRILAAVATTIFLVAGSAFAAIVNPGETITDDWFDSPVPVGDLIDEDVRDITFQYVPPPGYEFLDNTITSVDATFRGQVYRDPATQRLSFVYRWEEPVPGVGLFGYEGGTMTVQSFTGFTTDVSGDLSGFEGTINRSADGSTLTAVGQGQGLGAVRFLIVATNATEYDQGGTLETEHIDEFTLLNLETQEQEGLVLAGAQQSLTGTFQPITGGTVIPLPAGVWAGLAMLGGTGIARRLRRR